MSPREVRAKAPGRTRAPRLPAAERRAEILRRSAKLFQQRGYTGVGIDDIGADIGVSGPALYRHFAGKEAILLTIGRDFLERAIREANTVLDAGDSDDQADRLIEAVVCLALDSPAELTVTLRHMWALSNAVDREQISQRWNELGRRCAPVLVAAYPDLDPDAQGLYVRGGAGLLLGMTPSLRNLTRARVAELASTGLSAMLSVPMRSTADREELAEGGWARSSRREQILETAINLFRERGFRGVSMAEIADAVGVTAAAPYRHFKSKEDILATAILRTSERVTNSMNEALAVASSAGDALDRILRSYVSTAVDNADLFAVSTTEYHHIDDSAKAARKRNQQLFFEEWVHCLATVRPDLTTTEALALVRGVTGLVTESVRSRALARRPHLGEDLLAISREVLARTP